jgi:NAD+ kinase
MKHILIIYHQTLIETIHSTVEALASQFPDKKIHSALNSKAEKMFDSGSFEGSVLILTIGGDGTFVTGARIAKKLAEAYVVGIHAGTLGFLATWGVKSTAGVLSLVEEISTAYQNGFDSPESPVYVSKRHCVSYWGMGASKEGAVEVQHALNEFVITRTYADSMIDYQLYIGADCYSSFGDNPKKTLNELSFTGQHKANGLILASATGSTAYSLAEKGALIDPDGSRCMQLAPIAASSLTSRPIVVTDKGEDKIKVVVGVKGSEQSPILVKGDNLIVDTITTEALLTFGVSLTPVNVLQPKGVSWYSTLAEKLHWNVQQTHIWGVNDD